MLNIIYAEYDIHHNSIDIATTTGCLLGIDCWEAEKALKTTPCLEISAAKPGEAVNGGRSPFILPLTASAGLCYHFEITESIMMNLIVKLLLNLKKNLLERGNKRRTFMPIYKYLIFDMDDTLLDFYSAFSTSQRNIAEKLRIEPSKEYLETEHLLKL